MIIDFPEFDNESMGGCSSFQFIPVKHTQSLANPVDCVIPSMPVPISGKSITNGLSIMDTLSFNEKPVDHDAGSFFKTEISGFVPKLTPGYLALFNEMRRYRHIVMPTDNNGCVHVCGTLTLGLKFSFERDTKETPAGGNGFQFKFYGEFIEPSPTLISS